jgi:small subunit ribosomal protein S8
MSMSDPIADLLTHIRNGQRAGKESVTLPSAKGKVAICKVLKDEGYIEEYQEADAGSNRRTLTVKLKYFEGAPVIDRLDRVSRPGLRIYRGKDDLPRVQNGLGVAIVSTSRGVMSDRAARAIGQGGEVLCVVS